MSVDLLLGSDIGLWVLQHIQETEGIRHVISLDDATLDFAQALGLKTVKGNANEKAYEPAPIGLSVHYPRLIRPALLNRYRSLYNLHPAYLPWGRGFYPVFWALWEQTPAGATLHQIAPGIDDGPIVCQVAVPYTDADTGESLLERVRATEKRIFLEYWPRIRRGETIPTFPQIGAGTYHAKNEFLAIKQPQDWESWPAGKLIHLARCLTHSSYPGLQLTLGSATFELQLTRQDNSTNMERSETA